MQIPYTQDEISAACIEAAEAQNIKDGYIRPVAFRGSEMMAVSAQNTNIHVAIACWPWPSYFSPEEKLKGIRLESRTGAGPRRTQNRSTPRRRAST